MLKHIFLLVLLTSIENGEEVNDQKTRIGSMIRKRITDNVGKSDFLKAILAVTSSSERLNEIYLVDSLACLDNANHFQEKNEKLASYKIYEDYFLVSVKDVKEMMECSSEFCVIAFCSPEKAIHVLNLVKNNSLESRRLRWLIYLNYNNTSAVSSLERTIREGSMVTLLQKKEDGMYTLLTSRVGADNAVRFQKVRPLNLSENKLLVHSKPPFPDIKELCSDFEGRKIVVAALKVSPSVFTKHGFDSNALQIFAEKMKFRYGVAIPPDAKYGQLEKDGTVSGLIGMVARREAYMALGKITIDDSRDTVVDFSTPYAVDSLGLISKSPAKKIEPFLVFHTFQLWIWGIIAGLVLVVGSLAYFFLQVAFKLDDKLSMAPSLQETSFQVFSSLVVKDADLPLRSLSSKILLGSWFILCLLVWSIYSGTLVATFAVPRYEKPIDSLEDLVRSGKHIPVATKGSSNAYYFTEATNGIRHEVAKLFRPNVSFPTSVRDAIAKVKYGNGKYVYVKGMLHVEMIFINGGEKLEDYYFGKTHFYFQGYGMVLQSGSLCLEKFDELILNMIASGLETKWMEKNFKKGAEKESQKNKEPDPISLVVLQGAFYLLVVGLTVSGVCFLAEILVRKLKNN